MQKSSCENIIASLVKHPVAVLAVLCFVCNIVTLAQQEYINLLFVLAIFILIFALCVYAIKVKFDARNIKKTHKLLTYIVTAALFGILFVLFAKSEHKAVLIGIAGLVILTLIALRWYKIGVLTPKRITLLLFAAGFLLRLVYVLYTGCMTRQHDVEVFGEGQGHSGYIEYIYSNNKLPDFDVRSVWQFYHPPLHHIIAAVFLKLQVLCAVDYNMACESIQILTLFYSSLCMIISYRLMRELGLTEKTTALIFAVTAFHPTFIIFAGSINNDILSITLSLASLLYTVRWYKNQTLKGMLKIALCVGLGMMTKLSVWMVAPAIAAVFIYAFFKSERKRKILYYGKNYAAFGVVCVPLGLWWGIRNLLSFGVPLTYIPKISDANPQYVGYIPVFRRLFDFSLNQVQNVFDKWGDPYYEYNPTIGLLKTAMFGEKINDADYPQISFFGTVLFWLGTILAILAAAAIIMSFKRNFGIKQVPKILLLGTAFVTFIMYYSFCITYDFTCTQNIRYATPQILIGSIYLGYMTDGVGEVRSRGLIILQRSLYLIIPLFCLFSALTYLMIGFG